MNGLMSNVVDEFLILVVGVIISINVYLSLLFYLPSVFSYPDYPNNTMGGGQVGYSKIT